MVLFSPILLPYGVYIFACKGKRGAFSRTVYAAIVADGGGGWGGIGGVDSYGLRLGDGNCDVLGLVWQCSLIVFAF
jgi:hypothetical protein